MPSVPSPTGAEWNEAAAKENFFAQLRPKYNIHGEWMGEYYREPEMRPHYSQRTRAFKDMIAEVDSYSYPSHYDDEVRTIKDLLQKGVVQSPDELIGQQVRINVTNKNEVFRKMFDEDDERETIDQMVRREADERERKAELANKLALLDAYGDDAHENGTVVKFSKTFVAAKTTYVYAALKTNDTWFITGNRGLFGFTSGSWKDFVLALISGDFPVEPTDIVTLS